MEVPMSRTPATSETATETGRSGMRQGTMPHAFPAGVALTLLAACATTYVVPADDAQLAHAHGTAVVAQNAGIEVIADADAWSGSTDVVDDVVPIRLTVTNRSTRSVYLSPTDVELVGPGKSLHAEPLQYVAPRPLRTTLGMDPTEFDQRAAASSDQALVHSRASRLRDEVVERGLRTQRIDPGRSAVGFAYFERTSWDEGRIELRVVLRDGPAGAVLTTVSLPFAARS
jgi:hypothetical protein